MIKVAFPVIGSSQWWGGVTYMSNLLYAISRLGKRLIEPVILSGIKTEQQTLSMYKPNSGIIRNTIFDAGSTKWFLNRVASKLTGSELLVSRVIEKNEISVFSHLNYGIKGNSAYKTIAWIPDFQHLHLPEMFSKEEINGLNRSFAEMAEKCDLVILSSKSAMNDFCTFAPSYSNKARVLHFTAQPDPFVYDTDRNLVESKLGLRQKYFFLPNQFWKHKNHAVVFKAVNLLRKKHENVLLVCSGAIDDYRNRHHMARLTHFIKLKGLEKNIRLLGVINRQALFCLMRNCISIINPSFFEGWSTTVEEAKSLGKSVILSDIPVHREQSPPGGIFFNPNNAEELANILLERWNRSDGGPDFVLEAKARASLSENTRQFGNAYQQIVMELCI